MYEGTGGVSLMALKLAQAAGCKTIITSSSDEKLRRVQQIAGTRALSTINYAKTPKWEEETVRLNGGRGVDVVIENGGTSSIIQSLKATAKGGIISQVGYLGKQNSSDLEGLVPLLIDKTAKLRYVGFVVSVNAC
jgi:NADPH:quinone reductase-like Zn-dependent oxidoreductase